MGGGRSAVATFVTLGLTYGVWSGLLLDATVTRPWHFYLTFGVLTSLGVSTAGWVPAVVIVQRWYPERVGTVLGFTSAGIGVGTFLVGPPSQVLIDLVGWRDAYRALAVISTVWIVPAAIWVLRDPPRRAAALRPLGPAAVEAGLREAATSRRFWLIALAQGSASFANQMLLAHQVAYLVDHGVTSLAAASVVGLVGLASIVGKGGGGWASDTVGREITYTTGMTGHGAADAGGGQRSLPWPALRRDLRRHPGRECRRRLGGAVGGRPHLRHHRNVCTDARGRAGGHGGLDGRHVDRRAPARPRSGRPLSRALRRK